MSETLERKASPEAGANEIFTVDKGYLRNQAKQAVTLFLTPVSGVVWGATGKGKRFRRFNMVRKPKKTAT